MRSSITSTVPVLSSNLTNCVSFSPIPPLTLIEKNSSESSYDDDAYLDEQEDPMTDQQTDNNQASSIPAGAGNTLPIKSTGNTSRAVNFCSKKSMSRFKCRWITLEGFAVTGARTTPVKLNPQQLHRDWSDCFHSSFFIPGILVDIHLLLLLIFRFFFSW